MCQACFKPIGNCLRLIQKKNSGLQDVSSLRKCIFCETHDFLPIFHLFSPYFPSKKALTVGNLKHILTPQKSDQCSQYIPVTNFRLQSRKFEIFLKFCYGLAKGGRTLPKGVTPPREPTQVGWNSMLGYQVKFPLMLG